MYLCKENHLYEKMENLAHCFPVRIQFVFERSTSGNLVASSGREAVSVPNRPIELN
jgi:hypothetical protein